MKLVCGIGINDANYAVQRYEKVDGKSKRVWTCPFYLRWDSMLTRCYNSNYQKDKPSYINSTVCPDWLYFTNFKSWMEKQDWEGKHLDKDLLVPGNKVYSADTCCFIPLDINIALSTHKKKSLNRNLPTGITIDREGRFCVQISRFGVNKKIGRTKDIEEAIKIYKEAREQYIRELADKFKEILPEKVYNVMYDYKE